MADDATWVVDAPCLVELAERLDTHVLTSDARMARASSRAVVVE
jgi:predicted nucleic acid-binding protein